MPENETKWIPGDVTIETLMKRFKNERSLLIIEKEPIDGHLPGHSFFWMNQPYDGAMKQACEFLFTMLDDHGRTDVRNRIAAILAQELGWKEG